MPNLKIIATQKIRRAPHWLKIAAGLLGVITIGLIVVIMRMNDVPADLNTATTRLTVEGLFEISYAAQLEPLAINQIHTWILHVESADGQVVENAEISVDGGMPQHGHGLPTAPEVTGYLGNGDYLVEGMKFNMSGWWILTFQISHNGLIDTVTFNLLLD